MPILFLDRDGVLVRFPGRGKYVTRPPQMKLIPRSAAAVALLTKAGYEIHVVSNQGCVSRGLLSAASLAKYTQRMLAEIRRAGGRIRKVHYCPHQSSDGCACKKPRTLLLKRALSGRRPDRKKIYFVGDSVEDVGAGQNFGCRTILVLSGRNKKKDVKGLGLEPDHVMKDLWEASLWLTRKKS